MAPLNCSPILSDRNYMKLPNKGGVENISDKSLYVMSDHIHKITGKINKGDIKI